MVKSLKVAGGERSLRYFTVRHVDVEAIPPIGGHLFV
jgi:hypothetical protein